MRRLPLLIRCPCELNKNYELEVWATFNWNTLAEGLTVTGVGMGFVAVVLVVLQLTIAFLGWTDRSEHGSSQSEDEAESIQNSPSATPTKSNSEIAAAIGVGLALANRQNSGVSRLVETSLAHAPLWVQAGRARLMATRNRSEL